MTRTSYAQNFEDVMLARALADISEGFYVDVGAQDPLIDSVTRMFYERGWRGVNIEPMPYWFGRLEADRPRDVNLMCAISSSTGMLDLNEVSESGLTTANEEYAREHAAAGWSVMKHSVQARKLDDIFEQYVPGAVHFLKIDVEGMEHEVLKGFSLQHYRPWILVIEATKPNSAIDVSSEWESLVLGAGYRLAYRDGLNRFYLAEERLSRLQAFDVPPNVFDDFIPYREVKANDYAHDLENRLQTQYSASKKLRFELDGHAAKAEAYRTDLLAVTDTAKALQDRLGVLEASLLERQAVLDETAAKAEGYRTDLLAVTETAKAQQDRLDVLGASLQERQTVLEETAARAEAYRTDLLAVTETAKAQRDRLGVLEASLRERQAVLDETAAKAEAYRMELGVAMETVGDRQRRVNDLEEAISRREAEYAESMSIMHENLHLIEEELRQSRQALEMLEGLQREVQAIYASRSWRLTAPLRTLVGSLRRATRRVLSAAAGIMPLRKLAGRVLTGRLRRRVLDMAGFVEQAHGHIPDFQDLQEPMAGPCEQATLSRSGMRAYRFLAMASKHGTQDTQ